MLTTGANRVDMSGGKWRERGMIINGDARTIDPADFKRYGVIVADPPWLYRVAKGQGTAEDQYDLMREEDIYSMPVGELALDDSVLFLWGTWPKLPEAIKVAESWGFEYVTGLPWIKLNRNDGGAFYGIGYWVRGCSEYVLICRKGHVSPPRLDGFLGLMSPNFEHSRKPNSIHEIAEALPGPYLELFARRDRAGWDCFGNEVQPMPPMLEALHYEELPTQAAMDLEG